MIRFTTQRAQSRFSKIDPTLFRLITEIGQWLEDTYKKDLMITETVTTQDEDTYLKRVSKTHQEGRAVDIRNINWSDDIKKALLNQFPMHDSMFGAISLTDGIRRFFLDHDNGNGRHLHCQCGRDIIEKIKKEKL